jgi:hypothetical protein
MKDPAPSPLEPGRICPDRSAVERRVAEALVYLATVVEALRLFERPF